MSLYVTYTDEELVEFLRIGDHAAFTEIFNRYWGSLLDAAYQRLKSREAAEEVTQDVLVSLYIRRAQIAPKSSLEAYLKSALKYKVIDTFRTQQLHNKHLHYLFEESRVDTIQPDETLKLQQLRQQIQQIVDKLPAKCREAFMLSRFEELSHKEISERMGISIVTVKSHLNHALKVLRREFDYNQFDLLAISFFVFLQ